MPIVGSGENGVRGPSAGYACFSLFQSILRRWVLYLMDRKIPAFVNP
jgi:hypothetical protein